MCNIIHKPAGVVLTEKSIRATHQRNSDGFGYMYWDPEKKRIFAFKGMMGIQEILKSFKDTEQYEALYHFRLRTHGAKDFERCHPFGVLVKKHGDPEDMYFMHNGVFQIPTQGQESDTMAFNRVHLQPLFRNGTDIIRNPTVQLMLKSFIGYNKLAFMYGEGEVTIINKEAGDQYEGCWVSNKGSMTDWYNNSGRSGHNSVTAGSKYFGKYQLRKGDIVHVFNERHPQFYVEGKVSSDNTSHSIDVEYVDKDGKHHSEARFLNTTGHCGDYFMIPENRMTPNMFACQTVETFEKSCTTNEPFETEESKKKSLMDTTAGIGTEAKQVGNVVVSKFGKKKEEKNTANMEEVASVKEACSSETCGASFLQPSTEYDLNTISDGLFNFNSKDNRWGGASLEGPDTEYGPVDGSSYTIRDLYELSSQDRFDFFRSNPVISFAIFEDLIEKETLVADGFDGVEAKKERGSSPLLLEHKKESATQ